MWHEIITQNLGMSRTAAKFLSHLLFDGRKQNSVNESKELLSPAKEEANVLKNNSTRDHGCMDMMLKQNFSHQNGCQKLSLIHISFFLRCTENY